MKLIRFLLLLTLLLGATVDAIAESRIALKERDEWTGTYFKGQKLGFTHARVTTDGDDIAVHTRVFVRLKAGGKNQSTIVTQETHLDRNLRLKHFSLLQEIMGNRQRVEGRLVDGELEYEITTRGYQKTKSMDFPSDVIPASTVWLNILDRGLTVGKKGTIPIFIEPFQMISPMQYEILRKETIKIDETSYPAFVIKQQYAGMKTTVWLTPEGQVIKEQAPYGFESQVEDKKTVQNLGKEAMSVSNFITLSLVTPNRKIENPQELASLKLKLTSLPGPKAIPQDQRQKILAVKPDGNQRYSATVQINREPQMNSSTAPLPVKNVPDPAYLEETPEIQSKHGLLRGQARVITEKTSNAWEAALAINHWVHDYLDKVLVDSFTALDAFHNRQGECQSHTNLFIALARASGIPARVVNGLVYSKQYKGFLYHAWPEVYVGEWRALDPTFGQDAVDATHIKLSVGNHEGAIKLVEFLGQVGVELYEN